MPFERFVGVDYSGAQTANSRLSALQLYAATPEGSPTKIRPAGQRPRNWSREELAHWLLDLLTNEQAIVGIDHGFSFPRSYMQRNKLRCWDSFLADFCAHWPTHQHDSSVEQFREGNPRTGRTQELRLTETWTAGAKSVFQFDVQGQVAKSTHAGLPWLQFLRTHPVLQRRPIHFWPFDGFDPPSEASVITEVFPSLLRRRHPRQRRSVDEHDAWSIARWLQQLHAEDRWRHYLQPPLNEAQQATARVEGWILGVS